MEEVLIRSGIAAMAFVMGYCISMNQWRPATQTDPKKLWVASRVLFPFAVACGAAALAVGIFAN